jgi:hypothetical protein
MFKEILIEDYCKLDGVFQICKICEGIQSGIKSSSLDPVSTYNDISKFFVRAFPDINSNYIGRFSGDVLLVLTIIHIKLSYFKTEDIKYPLKKFTDLRDDIIKWSNESLVSNASYSLLINIIDSMIYNSLNVELEHTYEVLLDKGFSIKRLNMLSQLIYIYESQKQAIVYLNQIPVKELEETGIMLKNAIQIKKNFITFITSRKSGFKNKFMQFFSNKGFSQYFTRLYAILYDKSLFNAEMALELCYSSINEFTKSDMMALRNLINSPLNQCPDHLPLYIYQWLIIYAIDNWMECGMFVDKFCDTFILPMSKYMSINYKRARPFPIICQSSWFTFDVFYKNKLLRVCEECNKRYSCLGEKDGIFLTLSLWYSTFKESNDGKIYNYEVPLFFEL